MNSQPLPIRTLERAAPSDDGEVGAQSVAASASEQGALAEAQARRIRELELRLAERTRVLTDAAEALAQEIRRREQAQAALFEAQRLEAFGHLAGGLAHDLRNLLFAVGLGYKSLALKTIDPEILKIGQMGERALGQAHGLIERFLNLMRRREDRPEVIDPAEWLAEMEDLLGYAAGREQICRVRIEPGVWPVRADEHRLGAALVNLVVNARDAMSAGGEILVAVGNLPQGAPRPRTVPDGDFAVFSVADTGCGMTAEVLARAADPLFTTKSAGRGTGLGLAMVQGFVHNCAGYLSIASEPGEGTRVELYLPRSAPCALAPPAARDEPPRPSAADTVLLVDDDDLLRPGIAAMLRESGYRVVESNSAEVALALLQTLPRLALAVVDLVLPGADGAALVRRLRGEWPGLPALFITGYGAAESPIAGVPLLTKPFSRERLAAVLLEELGKAGKPWERHAQALDRLIVRLRSPDLLPILLKWRKARGANLLPGLESLLGIAPDLEDRMFVALREGPEAEPVFRFLIAGTALVQQLGRPLAGELVDCAPDDLVGTLAAAYRRAARTGLPSYEYARYALDTGPPVQFERLILPASRDGEKVSHLVGIVLLSNLHPNATDTPTP